VCDFERVETAADVILHRTGMGAVGRPANEAIDHVLDYLSEKRGWSDERRTQERSRVEVAYQRIAR
jgi:glycerol-3-phosphate dehydrogenase